MDADELEKDDLQDYTEEDESPHAEKEDDVLDDSDDEGGADTQERPPRRKKNGSGLAGRILSALMLSAGTIADAAQLSWTNAVRHGRVDLAEVCCTMDSQLAGEAIIKGGTAHR